MGMCKKCISLFWFTILIIHCAVDDIVEFFIAHVCCCIDISGLKFITINVSFITLGVDWPFTISSFLLLFIEGKVAHDKFVFPYNHVFFLHIPIYNELFKRHYIYLKSINLCQTLDCALHCFCSTGYRISVSFFPKSDLNKM